MGSYYEINIFFSSLFFVAFPIAVTQVSSNVEGDKMSVTRATGSSLVITCDLTQNTNYIHWYRFREGTVPQRLLYYDVSSSKVMLESGISPGRYHAYQSAGKSYQFVISNLEESDSGTYYCAVWEKHVGSDFLSTALEILLVAAKNSPGTHVRSAPALLPAPNSLDSEQRETWAHCPPHNLYITLPAPLPHNSPSFSWKLFSISRP